MLQPAGKGRQGGGQQVINDGFDVDDGGIEKLQIGSAGVAQQQRQFCAGEDYGLDAIFSPHPSRNAQNLRPGFRKELILQQFINVLAVNEFDL